MRYKKTNLKNSKDLSKYICISFIGLLIFIIRLPFLYTPIVDWDESVAVSISRWMLEGKILYKDVWDHRGPLYYFIFMPVISVFNASIPAIRLFTTLYLLLSMYFVYQSSKFHLGWKGQITAPLFYGLYFCGMEFGGQASNVEIFMMLPVILAYYELNRLLRYKNKNSFFLLGVYSSAAVLIKPTAAFSLAAICIIYLREILTKKINHPNFQNLFYFLSGTLPVVLLIFTYFLKNRGLHEFIQTMIFNKSYAEYITFARMSKSVLDLAQTLLPHSIIILTLICATLVGIINLRKLHFLSNLNILLVVSSLGVIFGRIIYPHYLLQLSLPAALLVGNVIETMSLKSEWVSNLAAVILFLLIILQTLSYPIYNFDDEINVAFYIKSSSAKNSTIFLVSGQPIIYFLSERETASKFFFPVHYTERYSYIGAAEYTSERFAVKAPDYIIKNNDQLIEQTQTFLTEDYSIIRKIGKYTIYSKSS